MLGMSSLVPRPYFFLLLSLFIHINRGRRQNEAAKKEMCVQLRKVRPGLGNRVIHKDFYERGQYVAHNRDVRYSSTHSDCTETTTKLVSNTRMITFLTDRTFCPESPDGSLPPTLTMRTGWYSRLAVLQVRSGNQRGQI